MVEDTKLGDKVATFLGIITFFIPEDKLSLEYKLLIIALIIIVFLIYKLYIKSTIIKKHKTDYTKIQDRCTETENKHNELSILFDKRINTIDELKSSIYRYNHLLLIFESFLISSLSTKEKDKQTITNLLDIVLQYKKFMEDDKNGQS